jgi:fumarate hydratase, class II
MKFRIENDTMGEVRVPADKYWGAQTQRSIIHFPIGPAASMPVEIIHAFGYVKKAALCEKGCCRDK